MLFGLAHEFQEAMASALRSWRPLGSRPASSLLARPSSKLLEALPDKDGENPVKTEDTFNMDESGLYYGQQPSRTLARGRTAGNKKDKKRMTVALTVNATGTQQLKPIIIHTAQKPRAFPKNRGVCSECALVLQQDCLDALHSLPGLAQEGMLALNLLMI
jgi:hypothetical protein